MVQETMLRVLVAFPHLTKPERAMYTIARRVLHQQGPFQENEVLADIVPEVRDRRAEADLAMVEMTDVVRRALNALPEGERYAVREHTLQGRRAGDVGRDRALAKSTITVSARRGMAKIRLLFDREVLTPPLSWLPIWC
ncbi:MULTISPECIES: RNA polymerase sigma factor [Streptomycetaceae]|uniref:RNA polymerase sigma factor n=1 Tax=Streptomycetaceae TaxID=2062 RepID=UPI0013316763|nr:hypothetical protein [Streptomyces sp. XY431]